MVDITKEQYYDKEVFMNLMTDFAFKRIFGSERCKHILIFFLNLLFEKDGITVNEVTFHDKEVLPDDGNGKRIIYDIYCTVNNQEKHIILEMQQIYRPLFENRALYYSVRPLVAQGRVGWNYDLTPVISIFLVDFHFAHMKRQLMHKVKLIDSDTHEIFSDALQMIFVHLKEVKRTWEECETKYDKFLFLIKNMHHMDKESKAYQSGEFEELFHESEIGNLASDDYVTYSNSRMKYEDDLVAIAYNAEQQAKELSKTAYEDGMAKGVAKGMAEGREKERQAIAQRLRATGMDEAFIQSILDNPSED